MKHVCIETPHPRRTSSSRLATSFAKILPPPPPPSRACCSRRATRCLLLLPLDLHAEARSCRSWGSSCPQQPCKEHHRLYCLPASQQCMAPSSGHHPVASLVIDTALEECRLCLRLTWAKTIVQGIPPCMGRKRLTVSSRPRGRIYIVSHLSSPQSRNTRDARRKTITKTINSKSATKKREREVCCMSVCWRADTYKGSLHESYAHERLKSSLAFRKPAVAVVSRCPARTEGL